MSDTTPTHMTPADATAPNAIPSNEMLPNRVNARIRRIISVALSAITIAVIATVVWIYITHPATYLSTGTFELAPLPTAMIRVAPYVVVLPIAALLLVVAVKRTDRRDDRIPIVLAIIAGGLWIAYIFYALVLSFGGALLNGLF